MPVSENPLPDVAIGRHPDFGIVATNPKYLAASAWMLRGFDFHPVPGHPRLYALADQQRDAQDRATRAVALLRKATYQVDTAAEFDPALAAPGTAAARDQPPRAEPDVAVAEHPQLGLVAAISGLCTVRGRQFLEEHGWQHHQRLDIYTLPPATDRDQALGQAAQATVAMHHANLQVAGQPAHTRRVQTALTRSAPGPRSTTPAPAPPAPAAERRTR
jgi:hypothetical protein